MIGRRRVAIFSFGPIRHFSRLLGTHPPLEARIKAVLPAWDGAYLPPLALGATEGHAPKPAEDQGSAFASPEAALALGALASEQVLRQVVGQATSPRRLNASPPYRPGCETPFIILKRPGP